MKIALTGNPNSGKTTMFNAMTGRNEKVGNWAGVTVERKEHAIRRAYCPEGMELVAVDLPGAYSMSPYTTEESVTSQYVRDERPDAIINIVDGTNLSRSLFFTTQLLELGIPMVVAVNKADVNEKKKTAIDLMALSSALGCPVVGTVASTGEGVKEAVCLAVQQAGKDQKPPYRQDPAAIRSREAAEKADRARYAFVSGVVARAEKRVVRTADRNAQDKWDAVLTHPLWGLFVFAAVMFGVFWLSQAEGGLGSRLAGLLEQGMAGVTARVEGWTAGASPILQSLLVDGVLGGLVAVLGFLPLVMVMYFFIALLEDCGYMARASVVLDPVFKKVGLSGKSVIPFVIGTGCSVPGVMACRAIRGERERRATAMLTPFMPCGAKLPVIALFAGAFFPGAGWVGPLMYFVGIALILLGALLVRLITGVKGQRSWFIIELPEYKLPSVQRAFLSMLERGWAYIVKAGTVILLCNTAVQVMQSFSWQLQVAGPEDSILASIARPFAWMLLPVVGVVSWQLAAAVLTGFIAKENVVGTLSVCFAGLKGLIDEEAHLVGDAGAVAQTMGILPVAALAYLMFNLFAPPCFAAIGAMRSEMKDVKWFWGALGLQLGTGYTVAYLVYTVGTLLTDASLLNVGAAAAGGAAALLFAAILTGMAIRARRSASAETSAMA